MRVEEMFINKDTWVDTDLSQSERSALCFDEPDYAPGVKAALAVAVTRLPRSALYVFVTYILFSEVLGLETRPSLTLVAFYTAVRVMLFVLSRVSGDMVYRERQRVLEQKSHLLIKRSESRALDLLYDLVQKGPGWEKIATSKLEAVRWYLCESARDDHVYADSATSQDEKRLADWSISRRRAQLVVRIGGSFLDTCDAQKV